MEYYIRVGNTPGIYPVILKWDGWIFLIVRNWFGNYPINPVGSVITGIIPGIIIWLSLEPARRAGINAGIMSEPELIKGIFPVNLK